MKLGIIGYGSRISGIVEIIRKIDPEIEISSITDTDHEQVRERLGKNQISDRNIRFYTDTEEMMSKEQVDGVLIGTRCSLHAKMASFVLARNLPLFLEKPIATSLEDLLFLKEAYEKSSSEVVVSFPLRLTPQVVLAKEIIDSGHLGTIEHVQAVNNVPYGGIYFHGWYRDEKETGGLFLQKATHDFDYITYLLGIEPKLVCAMKSKRIFKGNKPARRKCRSCDEYRECPESPFVLKNLKNDEPYGESCCFAVDTGNEDSGSALIMYDTGMHVSYSQNFFARKSAASRGARFLGYHGTLEFDWYTDELKVFMHGSSRVDTYRFNSSSAQHGGGDKALAMNFIEVVKSGRKSASPMEAGLRSALVCLKARESAETNTFEPIQWT